MTNTITREQIKENLDSKKPMIIVEALPKMYFDAEHLPGALNIPHDEIKIHAPNLLPDKKALIVAYCASTDCRNSKIATELLQQMGYTNAVEYVEGKQHWIEANFPVESTK
jgi:rhodanese-related sulfurtransferase